MDHDSGPQLQRSTPMAWVMLGLAAIAWFAAGYVATSVVPRATRLPQDVGVAIALPTVMAINVSMLVTGTWFVWAAVWGCAVAVGAALASKLGARGWVLVLLGVATLAGVAVSAGMLWAMELPEALYVRRLDGASTSAARSAIPRMAAEDSRELVAVEEGGERSVSGALDIHERWAATRLRLDVEPTATVEQVNGLLHGLDAIVVAGDPDAGWILVRVADPIAALTVVRASAGIATAARVRLGS